MLNLIRKNIPWMVVAFAIGYFIHSIFDNQLEKLYNEFTLILIFSSVIIWLGTRVIPSLISRLFPKIISENFTGYIRTALLVLLIALFVALMLTIGNIYWAIFPLSGLLIIAWIILRLSKVVESE